MKCVKYDSSIKTQKIEFSSQYGFDKNRKPTLERILNNVILNEF